MERNFNFKVSGSPHAIDVAIKGTPEQMLITISDGDPQPPTQQWKYGVYVDADFDGGAWVWGVYDPDCGPVCGTCYEGHYGANLAISPAEFGDLLISVLLHWGYEVDADDQWEEQVGFAVDCALELPKAFDAVLGLKVQQS